MNGEEARIKSRKLLAHKFIVEAVTPAVKNRYCDSFFHAVLCHIMAQT